MTETRRRGEVAAPRALLSKVPEITVWFWVIKILCTTVGESFADWINMTLGVGLNATALIFTVVLAGVAGWQLSRTRYVPFVYWLTVVVVSVTGTLYTDILTDELGVPLALSTEVFAAGLAVVFGWWWVRERTLSIHSIVTVRRELFYWLAILVTFALGTAAGDWTLELTGWGPGQALLLPAGLIVAVVIGWRWGANAVLAFWLAYILTRPLGANLGDWLAFPPQQQGLGLGAALTSAIFLTAILATVVYLTFTRADVIDPAQVTVAVAAPKNPARERLMLGFYGVVAVAASAVLGWAAGQPHAATPAAEAESGPSAIATLAPGQSATAKFPPAATTTLRAIVEGTLAKVRAGDSAGATARITDLENFWDQNASSLQALDGDGWKVLDGQIDSALTAVRADRPDPRAQTQALVVLLNGLK